MQSDTSNAGTRDGDCFESASLYGVIQISKDTTASASYHTSQYKHVIHPP